VYGGSHLPGHCAGQDTGLDGGSVMEVMACYYAIFLICVHVVYRLLVHMGLD